MQYRTLGKTGIKASVIGFGGMRFPDDDEVAVEMVRRAIQRGVNYFDSAKGYCNDRSERLIGEGIKGFREKVYISTKTPFTPNLPKADDVRKRVDEALERLQCDYIDILQVWCIMKPEQLEHVLAKGSVLEGCRKAQDEGLVRHVGFTTHMTADDIITAIKTGEFESVTLGYNLLNHSLRGRAIDVAYEHGMGVVIMNPVGGGLLAKPSEKLTFLWQGQQYSPAAAALRFVVANPHVTVALSGMHSLQAVEENTSVGELAGQPDPSQVQMLIEEYGKLGPFFCTWCEYCMPCPQGVQIPANLAVYNHYVLYGADEARKKFDELTENKTLNENNLADKCTACGQCKPKCTAQLDIPELLGQLRQLYRRWGKISES